MSKPVDRQKYLGDMVRAFYEGFSYGKDSGLTVTTALSRASIMDGVEEEYDRLCREIVKIKLTLVCHGINSFRVTDGTRKFWLSESLVTNLTEVEGLENHTEVILEIPKIVALQERLCE